MIMDPEPNRESIMDVSALTNDLHTADTIGTSNSTGDDEEGKNGSLPDSSHNSTLLQMGDCRICFGSAVASGEDPLLELGCQCKNDQRYGHESCLTKWFVQKLRRHGTLECDICRSSIGATLQAIVRNIIQDNCENQRRVQLLLQLPREELHRLQVPPETPFHNLPQETKHAVVASMDRQEEMDLRGETRQSANHIMAYFLAVIAEVPLLMHEIQAHVRKAAELRDLVIGGSVKLVDLFPNRFRNDEVYDTDREDRDERDTNAMEQVRVYDSDAMHFLDFISSDESDGDQPEILYSGEEDRDERDTNAVEQDRDEGDEVQTPNLSSDELSDTFEDDDMRFHAASDRHVVELDERRLLASGDELENQLNELSAHIDLLAANASDPFVAPMRYKFVLHSMRIEPFYEEEDRRRVLGQGRRSIYGRFRSFLVRDIV